MVKIKDMTEINIKVFKSKKKLDKEVNKLNVKLLDICYCRKERKFFMQRLLMTNMYPTPFPMPSLELYEIENPFL